jgi:hypothetical protein
MNYNNKMIISLPLLATISLAAVVATPLVAYGQDFLIGDVNDPVLNSAEHQERIDQRQEERRQEYLRQKELQEQQQAANPTTTPTTTTTTTPTPTIPADYIEVRSALFGAVISYPPDWEVRPPYNSPRGFSLLHVFAPEGGDEGEFTADRPNFNVEVSEQQGAMSQASARAYLEERAFELMTLHEQFEVTQSVPTALAGQPGWMIEMRYTSLIDGSDNVQMQVMAGMAGRTYLLSYSSPADLYDEYLSAVQNMINSFRVE